jgi:hypothetical protein
MTVEQQRVRGVREVRDRCAAGKDSGSYPFDWSKAGQVEREQHVLSVIKTMVSQGQTLDAVAGYLNRRPGHQPRHATRWTRQMVGAMARGRDTVQISQNRALREVCQSGQAPFDGRDARPRS